MTAIDLGDLYQHMTDRLNQLKQERTDHEEILAFYAKVLAAQQEAQQETPIPAIDLPEERVKIMIEEGFPLIEREKFPVDRDSTERLFKRLCQISLDENPLLAAAAKTLLEAMDSGKSGLAKLIGAVLQNDAEVIESVAKDLQVDAPILQALAKLSLQPSLLATAAAVAQRAPLDDWHYGYCPVCGGLPAMAALVGEEGKRQALCSFCGHFWELTRLSCPYCNTAKQEDLSYFYAEGEVLYRVHVCEKCRGYLKIMDTREGGDLKGLAVDDLATGHLDVLAEEEGYQRKAPRVWGI
jgi:FdhE protein